MKDQTVSLGPRERQIVELLLQGCDNAEIARELKMAHRTVKAHFNRLFLRFGISGGIKRVKLATLMYRRQTTPQRNVMETVSAEKQQKARKTAKEADSAESMVQSLGDAPSLGMKKSSRSEGVISLPKAFLKR
jgi:predicted DNA-binding transcriptional regulator